MSIIRKLALAGSICILTSESALEARDGARSANHAKTTDAVAWTRPDPPMNAFIDALIARMTLEEKIGQLTSLTSDLESTGPTLRTGYEKDVAAGRVGSIFNAISADYTRKLQTIAVERTRLKIPLIFGYDVVHGHRTIFPIPLGEAASWDMAAIEQGAHIAATEAAAEGVQWTFAPMVDIARDARWGRVSEGAGEDTYLGSRIAAARVRGFQGDDLSRPDTIIATAKHFAAYGAAVAGRDYNTTDMSDRELRDIYLPPFKAALDAGAATFMTAFNDLNGVPASGNHYLLSDILRGEWGFKGFVVTDYTSINEMVPHGYAKDEKQAGELAINAGVDMDLQGAVFLKHLAKSVEEGKVDVKRVDQAVRLILQMKYRLGLFDDPYRYSDVAREKATIYKPQFLSAARDMARKSIVLLKNENGALPLAKTAKSIALIGPLADSKTDMIGNWSAAGDRTTRPVTVREGLTQVLGRKTVINYAPGASYAFDDDDKTEGFAEAIAAANQSDVIVAVMGERWDMTGEAASRTDLDLPGNQIALLKELKKLEKPIILVLMSGRPNSFEWAADNIDAIVEAWYPGTMGGLAVADILTGNYNPSGKLPISFPRTVGQAPLFYNAKNTGRPYTTASKEQKYLSRYLNTPNTPRYAFGHGLSYTQFDYSPVMLDKSRVAPRETLTASVTVTNSGKRKGEEVVQLYVRDLVGSVTRPVKELKGFQKIAIDPGKSVTVRFTLSDADLAFHRADMTFGAEPGNFKLFIGTASDQVQAADFILTE